jgi:hypothetical protein
MHIMEKCCSKRSSTAEAELVAVSAQTDPIQCFCDNQATISIVKNAKNHNATKHIETRGLYARQVYERKRIKVDYIRTDDMIADMFTKAIPRKQFVKLRYSLGVKDLLPLVNKVKKSC